MTTDDRDYNGDKSDNSEKGNNGDNGDKGENSHSIDNGDNDDKSKNSDGYGWLGMTGTTRDH